MGRKGEEKGGKGKEREHKFTIGTVDVVERRGEGIGGKGKERGRKESTDL